MGFFEFHDERIGRERVGFDFQVGKSERELGRERERERERESE